MDRGLSTVIANSQLPTANLTPSTVNLVIANIKPGTKLDEAEYFSKSADQQIITFANLN